LKIIYLGRYNENEILTGPEKAGKRIFRKCSEINNSVFIEYFFDGKKFGIFKKLFGREKVCEVNGSSVIRLGLIALFFELVRQKPDIIHVISFERFALAAFLYRAFFKSKIVYSLHGIAAHENKTYGYASGFENFKDCFAEEIFIKYSDRILLLSDGSRALLEKYYRAGKRKFAYVRNGVDEEFKFSGLRNNDKLKVLFISDITRKEKGFGFLKDSLEESEIKIELDIVDRRNPVKEIVFENKKIECKTYDKMNTRELAGFLNEGDVFVSASEYEPFGFTGAECMSAGLVPVLTSATGASELITDRLNGFVFEYGNRKELNGILKELSENIELKNKISSEASKIYYLLNWDKIFESYKKIYEKILNR